MTARGDALRVGIVGCGRAFERCHLPALQSIEGVEISALADIDAERLSVIARRIGVSAANQDYRDLLRGDGVDIVAVLTPPSTHAEIGLNALQAGKHLFIEKPIALSSADADRLVDAVSQSPRKAMAGFNLRFHRLVRAARNAIDRGSLGAIATMHTEHTSNGAFASQDSGWRSREGMGGGVLFDLGVHHFDLWRFLLGCYVAEVFARRRANEPATECVTVSAKMSNGVMVTSAFSHGVSDTNRIEIAGERRRLSMSCYRFDSLRFERNTPDGTLRGWMNGTLRALIDMPVILSRFGADDTADSYRAEWRHFADAIRSGGRVESSFEDARAALAGTLAATESASSGNPARVAA